MIWFHKGLGAEAAGLLKQGYGGFLYIGLGFRGFYIWFYEGS